MFILIAILLFAIWSSAFPVGKMALDYSSPFFVTGFRMTIAAVLLLGYGFIKNRKALILNKRQFLSLFLLGFFSIYLTNVLELWGLKYLSSAKACFIYSLSPFFAALFSYLHFKEKMTLGKWLGLGVGIIGIIPVLTTMTGSEELLSVTHFLTLPQLAIIGAALFSVYGWILLRSTIKEGSLSPLVANGYAMLIGGVMALSHSLFIEKWEPIPVVMQSLWPFLGIIAGMILLYNLFCYNLYGMLLKRFTATFLSFIGLFSPIFASLSGWLLLGEVPSPIVYVSTSILLFGLWLVYREELKQGYVYKKS